MITCDAPRSVKRTYAEELPPLLAKRYGKQKHYSREQILSTIRDNSLSIDYTCWAMAMFEEPFDFEAFHHAAGEACSYVAMRAEMLSLLPRPSSDAWSLFDWDWISWDIGDWFGLDWFDWS
jgi:hypothetical protein